MPETFDRKEVDSFRFSLQHDSVYELRKLQQNYENYKAIADDAVKIAEQGVLDALQHAIMVVHKLALIEAELGRREKKI